MSRILVLSWSQSGQVRRAADAFTRPFVEAGHEVVLRELTPVTPYPFPWKVSSFFGAFPETVLERPAPIARVDAEGDFDLVIVASQIWFLSPSPPMTALFTGPDAALVRGRRTLVLVACRNMWVRGGQRLIALVRAAGGDVTDRVVATHAGPAMASYFTTLFWVLTGRRDVVKVLPKAEIADASYERLTTLGRIAAARVAEPGALLADQETAAISYPHAMGEQIGWRLYGPLATIVATLSRPDTLLRAVLSWWMLGVVLSLIFGLAIPCFSAWFLFGEPIRRWLDRVAALDTRG